MILQQTQVLRMDDTQMHVVVRGERTIHSLHRVLPFPTEPKTLESMTFI